MPKTRPRLNFAHIQNPLMSKSKIRPCSKVAPTFKFRPRPCQKLLAGPNALFESWSSRLFSKQMRKSVNVSLFDLISRKCFDSGQRQPRYCIRAVVIPIWTLWAMISQKGRVIFQECIGIIWHLNAVDCFYQSNFTHQNERKLTEKVKMLLKGYRPR